MFRVEIDTSGAAFEGDDLRAEVLCILEDVADEVGKGYMDGRITDTNGNDVGRWWFE